VVAVSFRCLQGLTPGLRRGLYAVARIRELILFDYLIRV